MSSLSRLRTSVWEHPRYPRWLLLNCLVGLFSTSYTSTILAVSLKEVAADLHSTRGVISWVMTAPSMAGAVAVPILGRLGDIKGHRRVYLWGFVVSIVFNALTAAAPNPGWLITCRTIAQVGGSATVPASFAILFRTFPPGARVQAASWTSAVFSGASVAGLIIGGPVVDAFGWQPLFIMQALLGVLAFIPALVLLKPDGERRVVGIDLLGALLLAAALFCLTFGVNRLTAVGVKVWVVALLVAAPLLAVALVARERRTDSPILPLSLVSNRVVAVVTGSALLFGAGWVGTFVMTPLLLQTVFGFKATATSLITLCRTLSITFAAPFAARAGTRFGERRVLSTGALVVTIGLAIMAVGATSSVLPIVVGSLLVTGWSWGHVQPAMVATIANAVDEDDFGLATSLQQMAGQIGSVVGLGLLTALAADTTRPARFGLAFAVATTFIGAGAALSRVIRGSDDPNRLTARGNRWVERP